MYKRQVYCELSISLPGFVIFPLNPNKPDVLKLEDSILKNETFEMDKLPELNCTLSRVIIKSVAKAVEEFSGKTLVKFISSVTKVELTALPSMKESSYIWPGETGTDDVDSLMK